MVYIYIYIYIGDTLQYSTSGTASPYTITAIYQPGSRGGSNLTIIPEKYNGLHSTTCGETIKFPYNGEITQDSTSPHSSWLELVLGSNFASNGLLSNVDFIINWSEPIGYGICSRNKICTINPGDLECGGPYSFKMEIRLSCKPETIWTGANFTSFQYIGVQATSAILGSIQSITFTEAVSYAGVGTPICGDFLMSTTALGNPSHYSCSYSTPILYIKYGRNVSPGTPTIIINPEAFTPCVEAAFSRPELPKFDIYSSMMEAYQDFMGIIKVENSSTNQVNMKYTWSYLVPNGAMSPDISGNITEKEIDYLDLIPETEYQISVVMEDPSNSGYIYSKESNAFKALTSCSAVCDTVTWKLTNMPQFCSTECTLGGSTQDILSYSYKGTPIYDIKARFLSESRGGVDLSINPAKYNELQSGSCGSHLHFPYITMGTDVPVCKSSFSEFNLSGDIVSNGLSKGTGYNLRWVEPVGISICVEGEETCNINNITEAGGQYVFKLQLMLVCKSTSTPWMEISFTPFMYYLQPSPLVISTRGSTQTITFPGAVVPTSGSSCPHFLAPSSLGALGLGGQCILSGSGVQLVIKYGYASANIGTTLMLLDPLSITPCYQGQWDSPILPQFVLHPQNAEIPAYMDNIAIFTVENIVNEGGELIYEWRYISSPLDSHKPILSTHTGTSYSFQYRLMSPGIYTLQVTMKDTENILYYYDQNATFTVNSGSCLGDCDAVIWTFTHNPGGLCTLDCVQGFHPHIDAFHYQYNLAASPYTLKATYQPGSIGGNDLQIRPTSNNDLANADCGSNIKFPSIVKNSDGIDMLASKHSQTLSVTLDSNGLTLGVDFTEIWVINEPVSPPPLNSSSTCTIAPYSLSAGVSYTYSVQLRMTCQNPQPSVWDEVVFTTFKYYDIGTILSTIQAGATEIETKTAYAFTLIPSSGLPQTTIFEISFPPELNIVGDCISSIGNCIIVSTFPRTIIRLGNVLVREYIDISSSIAFTVYNIGHPSFPHLFLDMVFELKTKRADLAIIFHESNVTVTNTGRYTPHILAQVNITADSYTAVTKTNYKFSFVNSDNPIPIDSKIAIEIPQTIYILDATPTLTDRISIEDDYLTTVFGNTLIISNWRNNILTSNTIITFTVENLINPYILGPSEGFKLYIYVNDNPLYKIFELVENKIITINSNAIFNYFTVTPTTLVTSDVTGYIFEVGIGDRGLESGQIIKFRRAEEVQQCNISTLESPDGSVNIGLTSDITPYNYSFVLNANVPRLSSITFRLDCMNPYTTTPINGEFTIWGIIQSPYNHFYSKQSTIPDMNIANSFSEVVVSLGERSPRRINIFTYTVRTTSTLNTVEIDTIHIIVSVGLEINICLIEALYGISGFLLCTYTGQAISISGITGLAPVFSFRLEGIRNPELSTTPISFGVKTFHSDEYLGENTITTVQFIDCNFPCLTCAPSFPDKCNSCYLVGDEVFQFMDDSNMYFVDRLQCVHICPSHSYNDTLITCRQCDPLCSECFGGSHNQCTKCYPNRNLFLYQNSCINPCPFGYGGSYEIWECVGINIYIYIYNVDCWEGCQNCFNPTKTGCTSCFPDYYWLRTFECIHECPFLTYYNDIEFFCSRIYIYIYIYIYSMLRGMWDMQRVERNRLPYMQYTSRILPPP